MSLLSRLARSPVTRLGKPGWLVLAASTCLLEGTGPSTAVAAGGNEPVAQVALGRELFQRQWLPNDPRSRGGDGLGPLYNATSCVACHNEGGPGGAGSAHRNVEIVTLHPTITITPSDPSSPRNLDEFHPG